MILESFSPGSAPWIKESHSSAERSRALSIVSILRSVWLYDVSASSTGKRKMAQKGPQYAPMLLLLVERDIAISGYNQVLDQNLCPWFQRTDKAAKYPRSIFVGPIVEDSAEEIYVCPLDGLLGEEVVSHILQSTFEFNGRAAASYGARKVLYDALEVGKLCG